MYDDSGAAQQNVLRWASRPTDDAESRRFLHRRLALYVKLLGTGFGAMYVVGFVAVCVLAPQWLLVVHLHPAKLLNLGLVIAMAGFWSLLARVQPSERWLRALEASVIATISLSIGIGCLVAPPRQHLEFAAMLIEIFALVLRAAFIPSTALRTALTGILSSVPVLYGSYRLTMLSPNPDMAAGPLVITAALSIWSLATIAASSAVSRVIYGLVSQVKDALRLGQYTLGEKLGEGGMGSVYRAEHAMLRRPTAVKLLLPGRVSAEALARFEREVQSSSGLTHPNTVAIYDYGRTPDGIFYYAMEYLDGLSLDSLVASHGPQEEGRVVKVLKQIAGSLGEAHAIGLIHRDIKPANVMFCNRGGVPDFVKVVDFGLVKKLEPGGKEVSVTQINALTGSPLYMAPEAITRPDQVDARVDLYALGAVGYFLLTGKPPFDGASIVEICSQHLYSQPVAPSERLGREVPPLLESLILDCLAKDPNARPDNAEALLLRLTACQNESPWDAVKARAWWTKVQKQSSQAA